MANLIETAMAAGTFATFLEAVRAGGLLETLAGGGPFTVFAPTDEAFGKFPQGILENLLKSPERLREVLAYHVVNGRHPGASISRVGSIQTLQGQDLTIKVEGKTILVDDAKIIQADIEADNGICHVIDAMLMP